MASIGCTDVLSVLLFLWSGASGPPGVFDAFHRFGPQDVMRLAVQIRANLRLPHNIFVITDLPAHEFCASSSMSIWCSISASCVNSAAAGCD